MCRLFFFFFFSFIPPCAFRPPASGAAFTTIFSSTLSFSFFVNIFDLERVFVTAAAAAAGTSVGRAQAEPQPPAHAHTSRCRFGRGGEKKNPVWWRSRGEKCMGGELWTCRRDFPSFSLLSLSPLASLALTLRSSLASPPFPSLSLPPPFLMSSASHEKKNIRNRKRLCGFFLGRVLLMRSLFSLSLCYNFDCTFSNY